MRSLKIASVLAASTAALALGLAAPASAAPSGALVVVGTAHSGTNFTGTVTPLLSNSGGCTQITAGALSGRNTPASDEEVVFYSTTNCTGTPIITLQPNQFDTNFVNTAFSYRTQ
ncbi:hypothetical protein [Streptomyces sp. NPDC088801]|uniref:hypothetical protein n=1 Tax=Streptomyces sp. NPDC088801 TaxID=3365903 RepID=UPI0038181E19